MLTLLTKDGFLEWTCPVEECGTHNRAHISDEGVQYRLPLEGITLLDGAHPDRLPIQPGAMIDLPRCECGARTSLKADYSDKELRHKSMFAGRLQQMKPWHARNLVLHHMLYHAGKAPCKPELEIAPPDVVTDEPLLAGVELGVLHSMWFTYQLMFGDTNLRGFERYTIALMQEAKQIQTGDTQKWLS